MRAYMLTCMAGPTYGLRKAFGAWLALMRPQIRASLEAEPREAF